MLGVYWPLQKASIVSVVFPKKRNFTNYANGLRGLAGPKGVLAREKDQYYLHIPSKHCSTWLGPLKVIFMGVGKHARGA